MGKIYLNGEEVKEIPEDALRKMSERMSSVATAYCRTHEKECQKYLDGLKASGKVVIYTVRRIMYRNESGVNQYIEGDQDEKSI